MSAAPFTHIEASIARRLSDQQHVIDDLRAENDRLQERLSDYEMTAEPAKAILRQVAQIHGVSVQMILGPRRGDPLVLARHHAMYEVARRCAHMSYPAIGALFNRDHTSVLYAVRKWPQTAKDRKIVVLPIERRSLSHAR